jgi:benzodiazapine receptor
MLNRYGPLGIFALSLLVNFRYPESQGKTNAFNSDSPITPAGWTFSIWGLIYTVLAYIVIRQALGHKELSTQAVVLFTIVCILNGLWIIEWTNDRKKNCFAILVGLASCLYLLWSNNSNNLLVRNAFSLYFGWVLSATVLNAIIVLQDQKVASDKLAYGGLIALGLFHAMYIVGSVQGWWALYATIPLVGLWTAVGIYAKHPNYGQYVVPVMIGLSAYAVLNVNKVINIRS